MFLMNVLRRMPTAAQDSQACDRLTRGLRHGACLLSASLGEAAAVGWRARAVAVRLKRSALLQGDDHLRGRNRRKAVFATDYT